MLPPNVPILEEMIQNKGYREFIFELDALLRKDPKYDARKLTRILEATARGERIVLFGARWVISSFVPPVPSKAFMTLYSRSTWCADLSNSPGGLARRTNLSFSVVSK